MAINDRWHALTDACLADEVAAVEQLRAELDDFGAGDQQAASVRAAAWIGAIRGQPQPLAGGVEALLQEYRLGSAEGIALMSLAEALLRIPDAAVADELIRDLLGPVEWREGHGNSLFVNATRWGLALTGRWLATSGQPAADAAGWLQRWSNRLGEPLLRRALKRAMHYLADQFVLGADLDRALARARHDWSDGVSHSFDMLGEAALTAEDSEHFRDAYRRAIERVGNSHLPAGVARPSVSVKLSALHPRYQTSQWPRLQRELLPLLCRLVELAAAADTDLTVDAEEADRLELSLALLEHVYDAVPAAARERLGLAVQAYAPRALPTLQWLGELAERRQLRLKVRLVKGAYWDSEIKRAQQRGLDGYPVFTRKQHTDIGYLACAHWLLRHPRRFFPQFATHNAVTVASLLRMQEDPRRCEFQRLHGMGKALYEQVRAQQPELQLRIYAPVGDHRELLPYLVRRLLENGANASFVHQLHDSDVPVTRLAAHPLQAATEPPALPLPAQLYAPRRNAAGIYLHSGRERAAFLHALNAFRRNVYQFDDPAAAVAVHSPFDGEAVGHWQPATPARIEAATASARRAQPSWQLLGTEQRARCLERAADLLQERRAELVGLMARESGKTLENGLDEVREAVDFCRYYAAQARRLLQPQPLPGPAGEENHLHLEGRGLFACISPWNFPLAIFTGQIAAALVTGNAVLAKPAEQSTLAARLATQLLHRAGVPADVLQLLPGDGETVGAALCAQPGLDGIVFTGGLDTARAIGRRLLERDGAIIPFIAETAGLNALIADSSALPQQLVADVLRSAFDSAGQRCSALRVLYLPRATATSIESLLHGAMRQLQLGDPLAWGSDIGPVIDRDAKTQLESHIERFRQRGQLLFQPALPPLPPEALFVPPTTLRLHALGELEREAFGPILHIIHYDEGQLDDVIDEINATGYGLTAGIHSRNEARAQRIAARLRVGNCYINRDTIGAVVGSQPFGGCGKSGTGPKAGGPHYLLRFVTEKTVTLNSAALGGDQRLLAR